jgi:hypothetical protein
VLVILPSQDTRVGLPKAIMPSMASALRHRGHVFSPAAARHLCEPELPESRITHVVARYNKRVTRTFSARSSYVFIVFRLFFLTARRNERGF